MNSEEKMLESTAKKNKQKINFKSVIITIGIYAVIIIIWQAAYYFLAVKTKAVKEYIFPNPLGVANTTVKLINSGMLPNAILYSLKKMLLGYFISLCSGTVLGIIFAGVKFMSRTFKPLILGLQTLPSICWVPFAILWFGLNESATIFVIVIGSTFSIAIAVESAIRSVNPLYIKAARTMGASKADLYLKVILPASIPEFISGIKQGWSFAWRALMAGEMMSSTMGLGFILQNGRDLLEINQVMSVMIIIVLFSVLTEKLIFGRIEKRARKNMGL